MYVLPEAPLPSLAPAVNLRLWVAVLLGAAVGLLGFTPPATASASLAFGYDATADSRVESSLCVTLRGLQHHELATNAGARISRRAPTLDDSCNSRDAGVATESAGARSTALIRYPDYPPHRGFALGYSESTTIKPGTLIDRYGGEYGRFASPAGTPFEARGLPPAAASGEYNAYQVAKPLPAQAGLAAPTMGQPGLGIQYSFEDPIADLLKQGYLKPWTGAP